MSVPVVSRPSSLRALIADELARDRLNRLEQIGADSVAWLALAPVWTEAAAQAVRFPDLERALREASVIGWCVREPPRPGRNVIGRARTMIDISIALADAGPSRGIHEQVCGQALDLLAALTVDAARTRMLARLAPALPTRVWSQAVDLAKSISVPELRLVALAALSAGTNDLDSALRREVLGSFGNLPPRARVDVAAALATTEPAFWDEAVAALIECPDGLTRLATLCSRMPGSAVAAAIISLDDSGRFLNETSASAAGVTAAAAVLAVGAADMASAEVSRISRRIEGELQPVDEATAPILIDLATAAAASGEFRDALRLAERIVDDPLRIRAYAAILRSLRVLPPELTDLADRSVRAASRTVGTNVDACLVMIEALHAVGQNATAVPLLELVESEISAPGAGPEAVDALVRLSALKGIDRRLLGDPRRLAREAARKAREVTEPATRAVCLTQVCTVATSKEATNLARDAVEAARLVPDAGLSATLLARAVPHLPSREVESILGEVLTLTEPTEVGEAFWMPEAVRPDVLGVLSEERPGPWLRQTAQEIGHRLSEAGVRRLPMPPQLQRWAVLASGLDEASAGAAAILESTCEQLLDVGAVGDALGWVDVAHQLLPVAGGQLETSALLISRRAELAQRQQHDRRHLERYLVREDQVRAFDSLLAEPDNGQWALHYLGWGGVGKTMLLRYLTTYSAEKHGVVMSRVDFDHLDPDYPLHRPGQLLLELLQELRAYTRSGAADAMYRQTEQQLRELEHSQGTPAVDALAAFDSRPMEAAIDAFSDFLRHLGRRVVLVLDTCEEVAKFQPEAGQLPQLTAMFALLERLHKKVGSVRVVLAGRRLLARPGEKAHIPSGALPEWLPKTKPYLQVCLIRGFSHEEAERYVLEKVGLSPTPDQLAALLALCCEEGITAYAWLAPPKAAVHYSPFDLAYHAAALREDPKYLETARSGSDAYVENRILRRLRGPARELLAAVVLLRRFSREMLAAAGDIPPDQLADAWQEFAGTEWLDRRVHREVPFLEVDPSLLDRLERFYSTWPHRAERDVALRTLGKRLPVLVQRRSLNELRTELVDAAMRCASGERAAELCDALAMQAISESAWGWSQAVFVRVLSEEGALCDTSHPAVGSAHALYAAALGKVSPTTDLRPFWAEVSQTAQHPDALIAGWLSLRGRLLQIACGAFQEPPLERALAMARIFGGLPLGEPYRHATPIRAIATAVLDGLPAAVLLGVDGSVQLTGLSVGQPLEFALERPPGRVWAITSAADGRPIAVVGGTDGRVRIWDLIAGEPIGQPLTGPVGRTWTVAATTLADHLAVIMGSTSGRIGVWDVETGAPVGPALVGHVGRVRAVDITVLDGDPVAVTGGADGTVRVWNVLSGSLGLTMTGHNGEIRALTIVTLGGRRVAVTGGADGAIEAWDLSAGTKMTHSNMRHSGEVLSLAAIDLGDGPLVVSGGADGTVRVWDLSSGAPLVPPLGSCSGAVRAIAVTNVRGRTVALTGGADQSVRAWDLADGRRRARLLIGDALAAVAALLDGAEAYGHSPQVYGLISTELDELAELAGAYGAGAFARMLSVRAAWLADDDNAAQLAGRELAVLAKDEPPPLDPFLGSDWTPPTSVGDRVRLELARMRPDPDGGTQLELLRQRLPNIDADRLISLWLLRKLATGPVRSRTLADIGSSAADHPVLGGAVAAHRAVTPLAIALSRAWAILGEFGRARACLDRPSTDKMTEALVAARLDIARQFRMIDIERYTRSGRDEMSALPAAQEVAALLDPPRPVTEVHLADSGTGHQWWRALCVPAAMSAVEAFDVLRQVPGMWPDPPQPTSRSVSYPLKSESSYDDAAYALDVAEAYLLMGTDPELVAKDLRSFFPEKWWRRHPRRPEEAARLALRWMVLAFGGPIDVPEWLVATTGLRRLAEIALDEGELLQLRTRSAAARLLNASSRAFDASADAFGALRAGVLTRLTDPQLMDLDHLQQLYAKFRSLEPALPTSQEVTAAARGSSDDGLFAHPVWGGWLQRMAVALVIDHPSAASRLVSTRLFPSGTDMPYELQAAVTKHSPIAAPVERVPPVARRGVAAQAAWEAAERAEREAVERATRNAAERAVAWEAAERAEREAAERGARMAAARAEREAAERGARKAAERAAERKTAERAAEREAAERAAAWEAAARAERKTPERAEREAAERKAAERKAAERAAERKAAERAERAEREAAERAAEREAAERAERAAREAAERAEREAAIRVWDAAAREAARAEREAAAQAKREAAERAEREAAAQAEPASPMERGATTPASAGGSSTWRSSDLPEPEKRWRGALRRMQPLLPWWRPAALDVTVTAVPDARLRMAKLTIAAHSADGTLLANEVAIVNAEEKPQAWPRKEFSRAAALLRAAGRGGGAPVTIRTSPDMAEFGWEASLASAVGHDLDVWRPYPSRDDPVSVTEDPRWLVYARPQWLQLFASALPQVQVGEENVKDVDRGDVLVICGTAVHTSRGLRISVPELPSRSRTSHFVAEPDDLPLAALGLVMVIGEPSGDLGRDNLAPQMSARLRRCADDLVVAGASAVVLLPAMPPQILPSIMRAFATAIPTSDVRAAAAAARAELCRAKNAGEPITKHQIELAQEITVFIKEGSGRGTS